LTELWQFRLGGVCAFPAPHDPAGTCSHIPGRVSSAGSFAISSIGDSAFFLAAARRFEIGDWSRPPANGDDRTRLISDSLVFAQIKSILSTSAWRIGDRADAGVVHEHRDARVVSKHRLDLREAGLVIQVRGQNLDQAAGLAAKPACDGVQPLFVARHQDQVIAALGVRFRRGLFAGGSRIRTIGPPVTKGASVLAKGGVGRVMRRQEAVPRR
jgi:hypothetical protein